MKKTIFTVSKMDCPSEEQMVRMKLSGIPFVKQLVFDLPKRSLVVYHEGDAEEINQSLGFLNMGAEYVSSEESEAPIVATDQDGVQRRLLIIVLFINLGFFIVELVTGFISNSMGLVADSLDMLADVTVYGLSLMAIGALAARKKTVAKMSGYFQAALAAFGFIEVARRFLGFSEVPAFQVMIGISILALIGNSVSLYLLHSHKDGEAHMQASWIFTANDVLVNIGVILAGVLVHFTSSKIPDLVIGTIAFVLVTRASYQILKLAR